MQRKGRGEAARRPSGVSHRIRGSATSLVRPPWTVIIRRLLCPELPSRPAPTLLRRLLSALLQQGLDLAVDGVILRLTRSRKTWTVCAGWPVSFCYILYSLLYALYTCIWLLINRTGIAQSFVDTRLSSSSAPKEQPDSSRDPASIDMQHAPDFCCPCGGFLGWKQIRLGGKSLSKSYGDLRLLGSTQSRGWAWETHPKSGPPPAVDLNTDGAGGDDGGDDDDNELAVTLKAGSSSKTPKARRTSSMAESGFASIERLPPEILGEDTPLLLFLSVRRLTCPALDQIISYLTLDIPPNGYSPRNEDLISCLLTSRTLHAATLSVLYRNMTFPHSIIFSKALSHISQYPALGTLVRRLDFSHFTSVGLGRTKQMNAEIQNLTARTLLRCLELLPNLKECLLQEHLEGDISLEILRNLFSRSNLQAVDFCGCSSSAFSNAFVQAFVPGDELPSALPNLRRLSLHECSSLPPEVFRSLLPRLAHLTHLDLAHTQVTEDALFAIPASATLTHLSLARCARLSGPRVVEFLAMHPAVRHSLVYLNLLMDPSRFRLLDENDVTALLPQLPTSLRSLNLGGAKITSRHMPVLIQLTKHLEELGLSSVDLSIKDLNLFFAPAHAGPQTGDGTSDWTPPHLCYLDLTKIPQLSVGAIFNTNTCLLLSRQSHPLQVIEFSDKIIAPLRQRSKANSSKTTNDWEVRELGRRAWYVRHPSSLPRDRPLDDGSRPWKMGARWWGMRKIPVAVGDVGGIYGHYMFKK